MDLVRAAFGAERDLVAMFADESSARALLAEMLHDDVEFEFIGSSEDVTMGVTGVRRGIDGVLGAWRDWLEPFSSYRIEGRGSFPIEEAVLTVTRAFAVTRTGHVELEQDQAVVWHFRDGKVWRWEAWLYADDAKAAFGL